MGLKSQRQGGGPLYINFHTEHRAWHGLEPRVDRGHARDSSHARGQWLSWGYRSC